MTYADVQMVRQYTAQHGPLSPARMYDRPAALIAYYLLLSNGGSPKSLADFMPFEHQRDTINFED
jgi:hypothetical protein